MKPVDHDLHCFATMINSNKLFLANSHFCLVLITMIANCLGPDQDPGQAVIKWCRSQSSGFR